ncbi:hypothetical protein N0V88_003924 [Collariella sp. IMI 366227]|nr:hypothetical protein N0V88_003924 [Collariella sp. IMI 366227]
MPKATHLSLLVDELLDSLGDEDFDLGEDAAFKPTPKSDAGDDAKKVAGLLESLQNPSSGSSASKHDTASSEDDDDSDGEQMARAVETVLSQLGDEINALPPPAALPLEGSIEHLYHPQSPSREPGAENGGDPSNTDGSHEPTLSLPTVPSKLVDPVYDQKDQDTFEKDISARMASLRGLGSLDPLGLPSAPTFRPEDHGPASDTLGKGLLRSSKYTDEDQTTWKCMLGHRLGTMNGAING